MRMVSNAAEPGCDVAKELWPDGCQSWVSATWPKRSVRRLMTGTTASPSATASAPPAQKSFCTSITSSTSSSLSRIVILDLRHGLSANLERKAKARSAGIFKPPRSCCRTLASSDGIGWNDKHQGAIERRDCQRNHLYATNSSRL